jgi:DNA-binding beta-propeller fold protein YncE
MSIVVVIPLYTKAFVFPEDWLFPKKAISYWWSQHDMQRVAGPPWYHLPRLAAYEFLPVLAALVWVVRRGRRMRLFEVSIFLFALSSVAMYAYLGEKVPWLGVHQVWAFLPLAGLQLARTFGPKGSWWGRSLAGVGLAATAAVTLSANFINDEISPNLERCEMIIYVQTTPETVALVREGNELAEEGHSTVAAVAGTGGWPLTWYWRRTPTRWSEPPADLRPPLVICDAEDNERFRKLLGPRYRGERIPLRAWWVLGSSGATVPAVLEWVFTRVPFNTIGSTDIMVFRRSGEPAQAAVETAVPEILASELGATGARLVGDGWLADPRGMAVAEDGQLAVADVGLDRVFFFDADGRPLEIGSAELMDRPEGVAWAPADVLVVADTWNHRVVLFRPGEPTVSILPEPEGGWFGPRGVAVAEDGTIAVTDTGNKRVVLYTPGSGNEFTTTLLGGDGDGPGELSEPVGLAWLDTDRLVVCDTGNRRIQILDRTGSALEIIALDDGWADFYSRPQIVVLDDGRLLVSDTPASALWLVEDGKPRRIDLQGSGITPTGLAERDGVLYIGDTVGRVWALTLREL